MLQVVCEYKMLDEDAVKKGCYMRMGEKFCKV